MGSSTSIFKKKYVKRVYHVLLVVLMFFLFDRGLYLVIRKSMASFYGSHRYEKNVLGDLQLNRENYFNALVMGSSRTEYGIIPAYLYENLKWIAFSSAKRGRYAKYHYHFYLQYRKKYGKPRFLIYGTDYFMFRRDTDPALLNALSGKGKEKKIVDLDRTRNRKPVYVSRALNLYGIKNRFNTFMSDVLDLIAFRVERKDRKGVTPLGISKFKGWPGSIPVENREKPLTWRKMKYRPFPGKEGEAFVRLLNELRKDRVKVFLVGLPEYIGTYETNVEREKHVEDMMRIARKYGNVTYFNFNSPESFDLTDFRLFVDGKYGEWNSHLSIYGAYRLTRRLCLKIRNHLKKRQTL